MKFKISLIFIFVLLSLLISIVSFAYVGCTPGVSFSMSSLSFFSMGVSFSVLMCVYFNFLKFLRNPSGFIPDEYIKQNVEVNKNEKNN